MGCAETKVTKFWQKQVYSRRCSADSGGFWQIADLSFCEGLGWNESKCEIGHCGCETLKPSSQRHSSTPTYGAKPTRFGDVDETVFVSLSSWHLVFSLSPYRVASLCIQVEPDPWMRVDFGRQAQVQHSATVWHGTSTVWHCCNLLRFCQTFAFKHSEHSAACCIMILIHIVSVQVPVAVVRLWTRDDSPDTGLSQKPRNLSWDLSGLLSGCSVDASVVCLMDLHSIYSCTILHYLALYTCTLSILFLSLGMSKSQVHWTSAWATLSSLGARIWLVPRHWHPHLKRR
jgi:hypothetical protein